MNRYAISYTVTPGSESTVAEILRGYRRPPAGAATSGRPLLRRTSVFMGGQRVVRVMDVEGDIGTVMRHLAAQPQIRAVEEAMDPYLASPRDLSSPAGVKAFLHEALLPSTLHRFVPAVDGAPEDPGWQRCGLRYPVRAGQGEQAVRLLVESTAAAVRADGRAGVAATTLFRRGDVVVAMLEVDGDVDGALEQLAKGGSAAALGAAMETTADLSTAAGFHEFLAGCRMELLTDRQVGVPA